jgi:hypothetical protein
MNDDAEAMFSHALAAHPVALSAEGAARRDAMRADLQRAVVERRQARHGIRAAAGLLVLAIGCWFLWPQPAADGDVRIERVHDQPGIVAELSIRDSGALRIEAVGDDETLRRLLDEAQQPSGLIRVPGRLIVEYAVVGED